MDGDPEAAERDSLPRLLAGSYKRGFTGRLSVVDPSGDESHIWFLRGLVVKLARPDVLDRLGTVLVQEHVVSARAVAEAASKHAEDDEALAAELVRAGAATVETMRSGLRLQLRRQLTRVFFVERARLQTTPGDLAPLRSDPTLAVNADARFSIYPGIRAGYDESRLVRELAPLAGARVRLAAVSPAFLRQAGFPEPSSGDATLTLLGGSGLEVTQTWLRVTGDRRGTPAKALVLALDCLDALNVDRSGERAAAPTAAAAVAAPAPAAAAAERVPPRRRSGVTGLNVLDPKTIIGMAEGFFKQGDVLRAERAFALALKSDPRNKRALAFAAWINFWKPETDRVKGLAGVTTAAREAVRADGKFASGHHFLGVLYKMANDNEGAVRAFRAALEADSGMFDSERELRLLTMRKAKA